MPRRRWPFILLLAASSAMADDLAPWEQPAAQPAASSGPSAATAALPPADTAAYLQILSLKLSPEGRAKMLADKAEERDRWLQQQWSALLPFQREQVRWAASTLAENGSVATPRAATLLRLGPPQAIYREPARDFGTATVERIDSLDALWQRLDPKASKGSETMSLSGSHPAELWVYPTEGAGRVRVLTFADDDGDGTYRFVRDEIVPSTTAFAGTVIEPPAGLFPPVQAQLLEPLPSLTRSELPVGLGTQWFKAGAGRTFARFVLTVDPSDVELQLEGDPKAFGGAAEGYVRVEQGGAGSWQGKVRLAETGALAGTPWMFELSAPLVPGDYDVTALVTDGHGAGGMTTTHVTVPAFSDKLAVSTPVVTKAQNGAISKAAASDDAALAPFQVGTYVVKPQPGGAFKHGDTLGVAVQVYNGAGATIEFELWRNGKYQSALEPAEIKTQTSTQILLQDISDKFPEDTYEIRITVKAPKAPTEMVSVAAPFRVRE